MNGKHYVGAFDAVVSHSADETTQPSWWALCIWLGLMALVILTGIQADRRRWRRADALLSWRLKGLRNFVARICGFAMVALLLIAALSDAEDSVADDAVGFALPTALLGIACLQVAVFLARRSERRLDEAALRERGLPVRKPLLPSTTVALLCFGLGPVTLVAMSPVLSLPLTLIHDTSGQQAAAVLLAAVLFVAWLVGSLWLTIRQWRRQRLSDRIYWPDYRSAIRAQLSVRDAGEGLPMKTGRNPRH